jgi:hypothetical protein
MLNKPCPHCGSFNDEAAAVCYFCKKAFPGVARPVEKPAAAAVARARTGAGRIPEYRRPGCVTLYALLIFLSGAVGIFSALYLPTILGGNSPELSEAWRELEAECLPPLAVVMSFLQYYLVFFFLYSVLTVVLGWGLWTMRNWARIFLLIVQGISLVGGLYTLFASIAASGGSVFICVMYSASLVVPGWIFLWFLLNRRQFR